MPPLKPIQKKASKNILLADYYLLFINYSNCLKANS